MGELVLMDDKGLGLQIGPIHREFLGPDRIAEFLEECEQHPVKNVYFHQMRLNLETMLKIRMEINILLKELFTYKFIVIKPNKEEDNIDEKTLKEDLEKLRELCVEVLERC